ncbi:hypothetical protein CHLRE_02g141306v5 [Chlamydomonas reinhardtii]|uniref:Uncharacterized protein n=1 Tax=Chlamydomonas reinhardtii TaxID=3055 RepID=A0A2K3E474_CHLRE|nr:uncharacterized protein CHLRE_02g141306v5 [Chlamydomonas reinhardtii]PNW87595.1 hypothetical protein CHLRE_02g141306v5 [Chlamydomonas reinhardtii]
MRRVTEQELKPRGGDSAAPWSLLVALLTAWLLCLDVCLHHRHISVARTESPRQLKHFVEEKNPSQASLRARFWLIVALYEGRWTPCQKRGSVRSCKRALPLHV